MDFSRIIRYVFFSILVVLMAALMILQIPSVQTAAAGKFISVLEEKIDADISLESIHFKPVSTIVLKNLTIIDRHPVCEQANDTLIQAGKLSARFSLRSLLSPEHENIILKEVKLSDAQFNLVLDTTSYDTNLTRCFRLGRKNGSAPAPMPEREVFAIRKIQIRNFAFSMLNTKVEKRKVPPTAIDWTDLHTKNVDIDARNFSIGHGLFRGTLDHLNLEENSGWKLKHLSASTVTGKGKVLISNIIIDDGLSTADLDYNMIGTSEDFKDFVNKVKLEANIRSSRWSLSTLSHFIPPMTHPTPEEFFLVEGKASGPVCDLSAKGLKIKLEKSKTSLTLYGGVSNLPDVGNMYIKAYIRGFKFKFGDEGRITRAVYDKSRLNLSTMGAGELYSGHLNAEGYINNLKGWGTIIQEKGKGKASFDAIITDILKLGTPPISLNGELRLNGFDIKSLLGIETLGKISAGTSFQASLPVKGKSTLKAKIDSVNIGSADFNGYTYHSISGRGELLGNDLTAHLKFKDPGFNADVDIRSDEKAYLGTFKINFADLKAMNLDKREIGIVRLAGTGKMDKNLKNISGQANLSDIILTNSTGTHRVPDMDIVASNDNGMQKYSLRSKLANADFSIKEGIYSAGLGVIDTRELLAFVLPGLYLEKGSHVNICSDSTGFIRGQIISGRVAYNNQFAKNLTADISGTVDSLHASIRAAKILAMDYDMDNAEIEATWIGNRIRAEYVFRNESAKSSENNLLNADIRAEITLEKDNTSISFNPSFINTAQNKWNIAESSISLKGKDIDVNNFRLTSRDQYIFINGKTFASQPAEIKAEMHNFDISIFNAILKKQNLGLTGRMNANAVLASPLSGEHLPGLQMDLHTDSLSLGGVPLGTLQAQSVLDSQSDKFKFRLVDNIDGREAIKTGIVYSPNGNEMDIVAVLDKFPIAAFRGLLSEVFSDMGGSVCGRFNANGPLKKMSISSEGARIDDGMLQIGYTNVPYTVNGGFSVDNSGIHIEGMDVRDRLKGTGTISGGLSWDNFKNMNLNLGMDVKNMEAINIPASGNPLFSGNIFASGDVRLSGPFNGLTLGANCYTQPGSKLHISISNTEQSTKKSLLTFIDPYFVEEEDPYQALLDKYYKKSQTAKSNFSLNIIASVDPTMLVSLDLGDVGFAAGMSGRGKGDIGLSINPAAEQGFQMYGDYTLSEGKFNVNAAGVVRRAFNIKSGSSIKFTGDVMKSGVDIDATYQTKASIGTLIADTSAVSNRRLVNCGIKVQNTLMAPEVKFSINIPDLEPTVKSSVESALSTEDKVQKQFLSLLLSNNFLPDEQSGVVNNASLLYANVSELMAGQINSIFSRLDIPLDLGLNYQPTDRGTDIFDVALSTQLFNNRVVIGGSLGNRQSKNSNSGTLVGDLDVEVKIDKPGTIRLSLFSHSADQYTQYLDNSQRNGIGLSWQQDFDNFAKWCRTLFMNKRKRMEVKEEEIKNSLNSKTLVIDE